MKFLERAMFFHPRELLLMRVVGIGMILWATAVAPQSNPAGCSGYKCGNLSISYPFVVRGQPSCYSDDPTGSFIIDCDNSRDPPIPYWYNRSTMIPVLNISLQKHEIRVNMLVIRDCYDSSGRQTGDGFTERWETLGNFSISVTQNKFTVVGCDSYAYFTSLGGKEFSTGCMTLCNNISDVTDGSCMGFGCCQTPFPRDMRRYGISLSSFYNHTNVYAFNPCTFAFIVENDYFNFSAHYLQNITEERMPMVVDWAVGSQTCSVAQQDPTTFMCRENTNCTDADGGSRYRCYCLDGYAGNPYLSGTYGCQDIDECGNSPSPCSNKAKCNNLPASFTCTCPRGFKGDGRVNGSGCTRKVPTLIIVLSGVIGFLLLVLCSSWVYYVLRQRKIDKEREKFFKQNGGLMLEDILSRSETPVGMGLLKVFTDEELRKATDDYSKCRILGEGGQGTVYRGTLANGTSIAVKKAKVEESQVNDFVNEMVVLSQIKHKNVVKLIGCCLETEAPLLVYEFIDNGTLFDHIHDDSGSYLSMSWETRLKIAAATARALAYLHYDTSPQIIHSDVKSSNILLDRGYTAKVSDFGASRLMLLDKQFTMLIRGTHGYLDPEFVSSGELTTRSDVYSFGIVLAELLTGRKAISFDESRKEKVVLSKYFVSAMNENRLFEAVDSRILNARNEEQIQEVAILTKRCLKIKGEERPTMKEIATELDGLQATVFVHQAGDHPVSSEETECLLGNPSAADGSTSSNHTATISMREFYGGKGSLLMPFEIDEGR